MGNNEEQKLLELELGGQLHDEWRGPRWREETQDYEPRVKATKDAAWTAMNGGVTEVDIANTSFEDFPSDWQKENLLAARSALQAIATTEDIEAAAAIVHEDWLSRNGSWAEEHQKLPYAQLSEEEKEKDRAIVRRALAVSGKLSVEEKKTVRVKI